MSEHILVTGGTGFIGSHLVARLLQRGHKVTVLTRVHRTSHHPMLWYTSALGLPESWPYGVVINLAGENLFARRWTAAQKEKLRASRLVLTKELTDKIIRAPSVHKFISGSAIGYYGPCGDEVLDESAAPGVDFAAQLCRDWEREAARAGSDSTTVQILRIGVVLGRGGGALQNLLPPFRFGLGGPIGKGGQWFSWIHIDDVVAMILACVEDQVRAPIINATAPSPVTNREFARALGRCLHRPALLPLPAWVLRLMLGEAASLLTTGQRVVPLAASEFSFRFPCIDDALTSLLTRST